MIKMGILGMGKMGEFHAQWIMESDQMQLVAVCERKPERVEELKKKYPVRFYSDCDEFLKDDEIDFVVIVTTHETHEVLTIKALNAGKHVIVEKPMCMTYEGAQRMIAAAEKNNRHLFVHQSSRWDRDFLLLKQVIESGKLGQVLSIESNVTLCDKGWPEWGIEGSANPWRIKAEYGGGMLFDWGPHLVDEILMLMKSDPLGVYGILQKGVWSKEVDDAFLCVMPFENDVVCKIQCSNNARLAAPRWFVIGTKGTFQVEGRSEPVWDKAEIYYETPEGEKMHETIKLIDVKESGIEGGFYRDLVPFLEGKIKNFVSMYEAGKVVKILEMTRKSSDEKRFIPFE